MMGRLLRWTPPDRVYLEAIRVIAPEYYDEALENYLKGLHERKRTENTIRKT